MRKKVASILLFLFLTIYYGQAQLTISKIKDSVFVFTTFQSYKGEKISSHGLIISTSIGAVMIDTPWDSTEFKPLLDTVKALLNQKVILVFSTHWHDDRTAGLSYYNNLGIPTYSSCATKYLCIENHQPVAQYCFEGDTVMQFGNQKIEFHYPGAGHSSDNMVVYLQNQKILFGGCFIKSKGAKDLGNLSDANLGMWPVALKNLKKKYPHVKLTIPGHFELSHMKGKTLINYTKKLIRYHFKGKKMK